jgi:hypothetical protein
MTEDSGMEVSQETIVTSSDISESLDKADTPIELFWDAHWTLEDDEWDPGQTLILL